MGHVFVWAVLVGVASVTPPGLLGPSSGGGPIPVDLVFHVAGYAILSALLVRAGRRPSAAVVLAVAFGLGIEGVQLVLPFRTGSVVDAAANLLGAGIGASAISGLDRVRGSMESVRSGRG